MPSLNQPRSKRPARIALLGGTALTSAGLLFGVLSSGNTGSEGSVALQPTTPSLTRPPEWQWMRSRLPGRRPNRRRHHRLQKQPRWRPTLALNLCLGLAVRGRYPLLARWRWFDMHQFLALGSLGLVALHILALVGDSYVGFGAVEVVVPLMSEYRPIPAALGTIALYLLGIVTASFYVRRWIGYRVWRTAHYATFGLFVLAELHGMTAGSDTGEIWAVVVYWAAAVAVLTLTYHRIESAAPARAARTTARSPVGTGIAIENGR